MQNIPTPFGIEQTLWTVSIEVALLSQVYQFSSRIIFLEVLTIDLQYSLSNLEAQKTPSCVISADKIPEPELTAAFQHPDILFSADDFVGRNKRFAVKFPESCRVEGRYAIMIRQGLNRLAVWVFILGGALCCIFAGVLVGAMTKSINLGVAVTSGIATVIACVEAFLFWVYK